MTVDPDSLAERTQSVDPSDLKMLDEEGQSLEETADIDPKLKERFDL